MLSGSTALLAQCGSVLDAAHQEPPIVAMPQVSSNQMFSRTVPVVVHVLYRPAYGSSDNVPDASIRAMMQTLNEDFAGANTDISNLPDPFQNIKAGNTSIRFCLDDAIRRVEIPNNTYIPDESDLAALQDLLDLSSPVADRVSYLNIYIVPQIGSSPNLIGMGTFPWFNANENIGIILNRTVVTTQLYRRTITHEAGHWLGLKHIWGDEPGCVVDDFTDVNDVNDTRIIARETGANNNAIYGNSAIKNDVTYGITTMGVNRGTALQSVGLQIKCNNLSCERDIWIDGTTVNGMYPSGSTTMNINGGIRKTQGDLNQSNLSLNSPAGNTFLRTYPTTLHYDMYYNARTPCTYYYQNGANSDYIPSAVWQTLPVQFSTFQLSTSTNLCPPYLPVATLTAADAWQQRNNALFEQTTLQNTLNNLQDGGNTPLTKNEVLMTNLQNAYQLYANLMTKSPYLSEEVLAELAEKEDFPKPLLRDIMVANKHAGKNVEVWQKLNNRTDELPSYMMEQIQNAAQSGWSAKEFLEYQIGQKSELYHDAITAQINLLDNDSTATLADYETVLSSADGLDYQKTLVEQALKYNNTAAAAQYLDDISSDDATALQDYKTLKTVLINLQNEGKTITQADSTQRATLENLAGDANEGQAEARVLWEQLGNTTTYQEPYPDASTGAQQRSKKANKINKIVETVLLVAPNPAKDYVVFELINKTATPANLYLYDAHGRLIETVNMTNIYTFNTTGLPSGIYFYKYIDNNGVNLQGKLNIQH